MKTGIKTETPERSKFLSLLQSLSRPNKAIRFHASQFALAGTLLLYALSNIVILKLVAIYLSVPEFGSLSILVALLLIATIPASAFEFYLVQFLAGARKRNLSSMGSSVGTAFLIAGIFGACGAFLTIGTGALLCRNFEFIDASSLWITGAAIFFLFQSRTALGLLSGSERYLTCASVYFVEAVVRVAAVWIFLVAGGSTRAIICALASAYAVSGILSVGLQFGGKRQQPPWPAGTAKARVMPLLKLFSAMLLLGLLLFLDVPLVGFWLGAEPAAQYAAAAVVARIALFLPMPFANTLFARVANETNLRTQRLALLVTIFLVIPPLLGLLAFTRYKASFLLNVFLTLSKFEAAVQIVPTYMLAMTLLGLTWLLFQYLLAQDRFEPVVALCCVIFGFILLMRFRHGSLAEVAENLLMAGIACLLSFAILVLTPPFKYLSGDRAIPDRSP